jgi:phenylacetate-CoA ligase
MREVIEAFFECRCYDHYGQSEGVCWVMQCPHGRMHVVPEFGLLEILDEAGQPCRPGVVGEMVVTGFINKAMPLIRYRTGDEAAWAANQQCACGQPFPIVERLEGRVDDYLVTADGRRIGRLSTAVKGSPSIHSAQIVQDRPGHAYLLVKPGNNYRRVDGQVVRGDILKRIGTFGIDVMEVDDIPRTRAGKLKLVVRLADKPELRADYSGILPTDHRLATTHGRNANG